jgi:hypothetical protein
VTGMGVPGFWSLVADSTPGWRTLGRGSASVPSRVEKDARKPVDSPAEPLEREDSILLELGLDDWGRRR